MHSIPFPGNIMKRPRYIEDIIIWVIIFIGLQSYYVHISLLTFVYLKTVRTLSWSPLKGALLLAERITRPELWPIRAGVSGCECAGWGKMKIFLTSVWVQEGGWGCGLVTQCRGWRQQSRSDTGETLQWPHGWGEAEANVCHNITLHESVFWIRSDHDVDEWLSSSLSRGLLIISEYWLQILWSEYQSSL